MWAGILRDEQKLPIVVLLDGDDVEVVG